VVLPAAVCGSGVRSRAGFFWVSSKATLSADSERGLSWKGKNMLKKGLLIVAAVAMLAMTAQAGFVKFEQWPCQFVAQDLTSIPVKMVIGYFIKVVDQGKTITLTQTTAGQTNYFGCTKIKVQANFNGQLTASVVQLDPKVVDGSYSVTIGGQPGSTGIAVTPTGSGDSGDIEVCVTLTDAKLNMTQATSTAIQVASVKIKVVPTSI
jgi:hypothetical protein